MTTRSLKDWLAYQQHLHPVAIDLGLDRVSAVWRRLGGRRPAPVVITVGGTNGKGTTVAMLEAMLRAAGHRTAAYTSPHLVHYNERLRIDGHDVADQAWVAAFARVEAARGATEITYFEFGTLGALEIIADGAVDVAILEVGLGGRLDAVNIIDADVAVIASVDLDHMEYLGPDRDSIGHEQAGIARQGCVAVIGERRPPRGLLDELARIGAVPWLIERDFDIAMPAPGAVTARWHGADLEATIPAATLDGPGRRDNAASSLAVLAALRRRLGWPAAAYMRGLTDFGVPGRVQRFAGPPELIVDVAHNPHAARALAAWLAAHPVTGRTLAVFSALGDKDLPALAAIVGPYVDAWHLCSLADAGARSLPVDEVRRRVLQGWPAASTVLHADPPQALAAARAEAMADDRILAFGSFHLAGSVLATVGQL